MSPEKADRIVITENPRLHVADLHAARIKDGLFRTFYGKDASLFYFGRGALWQAIQSLHLSAADNVLVPAYHCGVEVEAVSMAGVQLRYYGIRDDLTVDLSDLQNRIDANSRAVLLIHYFGFPQSVKAVKDICAAGNIVLVEDCSQALFSSCQGEPLGTFGDLAIFSQRKTLPLPDGGALLVNNPRLTPQAPDRRPSEHVALKKTLGMLIRSALNLNPGSGLPYPFEWMATVFNRLVARNAGIRYSTGMEIDMDRCNLAMSGIAKRIMGRTRVEHVIQRRRENYGALLSYLSNTPHVEIVHEKLPEGVCPLFFPVRIEKMCRPDLQNRLLSAGIGSFVFGAELHPSLPANQFRSAERLSQQLLCLPVHQDLQPADMARLAATVRQAAGELENAATH